MNVPKMKERLKAVQLEMAKAFDDAQVQRDENPKTHLRLMQRVEHLNQRTVSLYNHIIAQERTHATH